MAILSEHTSLIKKAKAAKHKAIVEANKDMLDLEYTIVPL